MRSSVESDLVSLCVKGGILFFKYKDQIHLGLQQAIEIVATRMKLQRGVPYPILCDISGVMDVDSEARRYLAVEGALLSKAIAFITDKPISERISHMFLKNYSAKFPVKVFKSKEEALKFLDLYKQ